MIEKMRKPKKSRNIVNYVVYTLIFGMIVASFVFMIPGMNGGGAVNAAAEVGSSTISLREYTDQLKAQRDRYSKMFNGEIPSFFEEGLKKQVLDSLVRREVLVQYAKEQGFMVSDLEVSDFIKKEIPAFQKEGEFSYLLYDQYLKAVRTNPQKFEEAIAKDLMNRRLYSLFSSSLTSSELEQNLSQDADGVKLSFYAINLDAVPDEQKAVSSSQIEAYLAAPENKSDLEKEYEGRKQDFKSSKKVNLHYLLIKDEEKAKTLASEITADNFAETAKKESEDPLSKEKGGDLGYISKGEFGPEIEKKAFSMSKGEVSKSPLKTPLGYALLYVKDIQEESTASFDEVKEKLAKEKIQQNWAASFKKETLETLKNTPDQISGFLAQKGLSWGEEKNFDLESETLPGVGASEVIISKLLSLKEGEVHPQILPFEGKDFLIKLKSIEKSQVTSPNLSQNDNLGRGLDFMDLVYQDQKKSLKINLNRSLLTP